MKNQVLIITGACGVGKTSTAKEWARKQEGAVIECDYLTEWIYKKDFPHWTKEEEAFTSKVAAVMAKEYLNHGMSVAIENVWSPFGIARIIDLLSTVDNLTVKAVRLKCEGKENHRRDETRPADHQMKERVDIVNRELDSYDWSASTIIIDSTDLTIAQVIEKIDSQ